MSKIIVFPFILLIKLYQLIISPWLGSNCRFSPTCSSYMQEALEEHGLFIGLKLGFTRLFKCHPWTKGGYDPIPKRQKKSL